MVAPKAFGMVFRSDLEYTFRTGELKQRLKASYQGTFRTSDFEQQYLKVMGGENYSQNYPPLRGSGIRELMDPSHFMDGTFKYVGSGLQSNTADY